MERLLYHSKEENGFTLFEQLAARDLLGSLEVLAKILLSRDADAVQLLGVLAGQARKLLLFQRLLLANYGAAEAAERAEVRGKRQQQTFAEAARRYSQEELRAAHPPHRPVRLPRPFPEGRPAPRAAAAVPLLRRGPRRAAGRCFAR